MIRTPTTTSCFLLSAALGLAACGQKPSGGRTSPETPPPAAADGADPAADGADPAADGADPGVDGEGDATAADFLAEINTPEVTACHETGFVYDRRRVACSAEIALAPWSCDRGGIRGAFAPTGFQIDDILNRSLGRAGDPDDLGEGYVIDQCGQTESGRLLVYLVRKDEAGRFKVREIEARLE